MAEREMIETLNLDKKQGRARIGNELASVSLPSQQ
jgi:hypothetical protein